VAPGHAGRVHLPTDGTSIVKRALLAVPIVLLLAAAVHAAGPPASARYAPRHLIVKFHSAGTDAASLRERVGASLKRRLPAAELWELGSMSVPDAIERLRSDPRIEFVEPDYIIEAHDVFPDDPYFAQQWGFYNNGLGGGKTDADIDATAAWSQPAGAPLVIGVIDSGLDRDHVDLHGAVYTNPGEIPGNGVDDDQNGFIDDVHGWDFVFDDNNPNDASGHGTHVTGIIAARGNNGTGVAGIAWTVQVMPIRILDEDALGRVSAAVEAIEYATRMGVRITNNSWGGFTQSFAMRDAIRAAGERGMLFVASSGNNGTNIDVDPIYPAAYDFDHILTVGATDRGDNRCFFSNYGAVSVDLVAPGSGIVSTFPDDTYGALSGTSMSAAFVSGAACLLWQRAPLLTHLEVKRAILDAVDPVPALADGLTGAGRLNAYAPLTRLDAVAPGAVGNLAVQSTSSSSARLAWNASGDDGATGTARSYDLRYSTSVINAGNFAAATRVAAMPKPRLAGTLESVEVTGLSFTTTYYFALVSEDEAGNRSLLSGGGSGTTLGAPDLEFSPASFGASVHTGGVHAAALTLTNSEAGTLDFATLAAPPWVRLDPPSGRVDAGQSKQVAVVFDGAMLAGGSYTGSLALSTNSPLDAGVLIPVSLQVTDAPDIAVSSTNIDFGPRFGDCVFDSVWVSNRGTTPLVVNGVAVTEGPFIVTPMSFVLAPDEMLPVPVIFCPNVPGRSLATLTIRSNDPDHPEYAIAIKGRTADPPAMQVSPSSLSASVFAGGEAHRTVTVSNQGGSDLDFEISLIEPQGNAAIDVIGGDGAVAGVVAVGRPLSRDELQALRASTRGSLVLGSDDEVDRDREPLPAARTRAPVLERVKGARLEEVFGSDEALFAGGPRTRGNIFACTKSTNLREHRFYLDPNTSGEIWFLVYQGAAPTGVYELVSASDVSPAGTHEGWYSSGQIQLSLRAGMFYLIVASFEEPSGYFADDSVAPYPVQASFGQLTAAAGWSWNPATTFPPFAFQIVAGSAYSDPVAYYQTLVTDGVVTWASTNRGEGTIERGASIDVDVRLHAAPGFAAGNHAATLRVRGNDPATPELLLPIQLQVTSAPDIALSQESVEYGACFAGTQAVDTVVVSNSGTQTLHVSQIVSSLPGVTVQPSTFALVPNQNIEVAVAFTPTTTAAISGTLTIASDDPDESDVVIGIGVDAVAPPVMHVSPAALAETIEPGESISRMVTITNSSPSPLSYLVDTRTGVQPVAGGKKDSPIRPGLTASRDRTPPRVGPAGADERRYTRGATGRVTRSATTRSRVASAGSLDVLILTGGPIVEISEALQTFPDIATLDQFDAALATPSLDTLDDYDAVLLISDQPYADTEALGDALADYVDQGGGVVLTLPMFIFEFEVRGRFLAGGYMPFAVGTGPYDFSDLGRHDADHPIMAGVQSAFGDLLGSVLLEPGARWIADWRNGLHLAATRGRQVAALNVLLLDGGFFDGDVPELVHNALVWVANPAWLVAEPAGGLVPPHQSVNVVLKFHADTLTDGDYAASVHVTGDDPRRPEVVLPVSLTVDSTTVTAVGPAPAPSQYALFENRPNPFNPATTITFELPRASAVHLVVYDVAGRQIRELVRANRRAGRHDTIWDGRNDANAPVASGVYFYRLHAGEFTATKKMILLK
jgi:subtilisin family serine protease